MKIKDFFSDIKVWSGLILFFIGIGIAFAGVAKIPEKVAKVEAKAEATENNVQTLAANLDKYIAINEEQRKADKESKELMLKLIEQGAKK